MLKLFKIKNGLGSGKNKDIFFETKLAAKTFRKEQNSTDKDGNELFGLTISRGPEHWKEQ